MTARATMAVIGGSGFYDIEGLTDVETIAVDTPFGAPSDQLVLGSIGGTRIAFLPRHGVGHRLLPSEVPSRANIWALASLGVEHVVSVSAVGSLREEIAPMDMVVPSQLIDRTHGRPSTFFGRGIVGHIAFDSPFCPRLSETLGRAAADAGVRAHGDRTYVVMEGPAFSTKAESELHRSWGGDIIGMTALPEAKLAREASMCYATLACVTDFDTWHPQHAAVTVEMIIANLRANTNNAKHIVAAVAERLPGRTCTCKDALASAIVTSVSAVPQSVRDDLGPILARVSREVTA